MQPTEHDTIVAVPRLLREVLYAPTEQLPPTTALLFEVALTHHNGGNYGDAVGGYMAALSDWENVLRVAAEQAQGIQPLPTASSAAAAAAAVAANTHHGGVAARREQEQLAEAGADGGDDDDDENFDVERDSHGNVTSRVRKAKAALTLEEDPVAVEERRQQQDARNRILFAMPQMVPAPGRVFVRLSVGSVMESAGRDEQALAEYLNALALAQAMPGGATSLIAATVYSCLGCCYCHLSQYDFAADYFFRALEIREQRLTTGHVDVALVLNNIGAVLQLLDRAADALIRFEKAGQICAAQLPPAHPRRDTVDVNVRIAKSTFLRDAKFPAVGFTPFTVPMIPGAKQAKKFYAPKAKKKKVDDKKKR
jgi:tetratricopeptide (TPR) repeat protein